MMIGTTMAPLDKCTTATNRSSKQFQYSVEKQSNIKNIAESKRSKPKKAVRQKKVNHPIF